jgi:hypothetical protein
MTENLPGFKNLEGFLSDFKRVAPSGFYFFGNLVSAIYDLIIFEETKGSFNELQIACSRKECLFFKTF